MKILLIAPPILGEKGIFYNLKYPPIGLACLAAVLREKHYEVSVFDANVNDSSLTDIREVITENLPDVVGITATTLLISSALEIAKIAKITNENIRVILGGVHVTAEPENALGNLNVDVVVIGEGEITILELMEALKENGALEYIKGIGFKKNEKIVITPRQELIPDLDSLPFPAYDLLPIEKYSSLISTRKPYITFIRSRGCPYQCIFCGVQTIFGPKYRCQSPERTIKEIDYLINSFGVKEILFKDSEFVLARNNVERLCELLIERKYGLIWSCNARADRVSKSLLEKMKLAGCRTITYGAESGDQKVLDNLRKGLKVESIQKAVAMTKEIGIKCVTNFMVGNPGENNDSVRKTMSFIKELKPDFINVSNLTPFPGSDLWESALGNNWFIDGIPNPQDIEYEKVIMNATEMPNEELKKALNKINRSFYFRPSFIAKRLLTLNRMEMQNNIKVALALTLNFLRSRLNRKL